MSGADTYPWCKYVYEGRGYWWWCEEHGDGFLECNPGLWKRYLDTASKRQYWWHDDQNWFWISGCYGERGISFSANATTCNARSLAADQTSAQSNRDLAKGALNTSDQPPPPQTSPLKRASTPPRRALTPPRRASTTQKPDSKGVPKRAATPPKTRLVEAAQCDMKEAPPVKPPAATEATVPECEENHSNQRDDKLASGIMRFDVSANLPRKWKYPFSDEKTQSFVGHLSDFLDSRTAQAWRNKVMDSVSEMGWDKPPLGGARQGGAGSCRSGVFTRGNKWFVRDGCGCVYKHKTAHNKPVPFPPWMSELMQKCMPAVGLVDPETWPNCCLLNCFSDGSEGIDWTPYDEHYFGGMSVPGERIVSLALGSERLFELRPTNISVYDNVQASASIRLKGGDLWTVEGHTPKHYMYHMPKQGSTKAGPTRLHVNLTWRWIVNHEGKNCGKH